MATDWDVQLELDDNDDPVFHPPGMLSGAIHIEVGDDVDRAGLELTRRWYTHGLGNRNVGGEYEEAVDAGEWEAGETYIYDFEIPLPHGPYTYRGEKLNVDWKIEAVAQVSAWSPPSDEAEFVVEPGGAGEYVAGEAGTDEATESPSGLGISGWLLLIFLMGMMLWVGWMMIILLPELDGGLLVAALATILLCFGVPALLVFRVLRKRLAEQKVGEVDIGLSDERVAPGDQITSSVALEPDGNVRLDELTIRLHGYEEVVSGHGTDRSSHRETLHSEEVTPLDATPRSFDAEDAPTFEVDFEIPETNAYSFEASENAVIWAVEVHVDIDSWPDWEGEEMFVVRPKLEDGGEYPGVDEEAEPAPANVW